MKRNAMMMKNEKNKYYVKKKGGEKLNGKEKETGAQD